MDIQRVTTTAYNPRSDGFVENHNHTLKDQLFNFVDSLKQNDWDTYLPIVQFMYNTTVSLSTGYTPMLLFNGREAKMPSFEHMSKEMMERRRGVVDNLFVNRMIETMQVYWEDAKDHLLKNKEKYDVVIRRPLNFVEYKVGQKFFKVRRPISEFNSIDEEEGWKVSMKLLERYEGPYEIIDKINPVLYIANVDGKEQRVHAVNMKPY